MKHLSLAVVGVEYDNKKGPTRRFEIAMCVPGERIDLIPEPKNPADSRAIAVFSARGIQIGYIRAERAPLIGAALGRNGVSAIFQQKESWGATIRTHLDGTDAVLPLSPDSRADAIAVCHDDGAEWWPDDEWPDD